MRELVFEPVLCACGELIKAERVSPSGSIEVYHGPVVAGYSSDELMDIGEGDEAAGLLRATRAMMVIHPMGGEWKPFARSRVLE